MTPKVSGSCIVRYFFFFFGSHKISRVAHGRFVLRIVFEVANEKPFGVVNEKSFSLRINPSIGNHSTQPIVVTAAYGHHRNRLACIDESKGQLSSLDRFFLSAIGYRGIQSNDKTCVILKPLCCNIILSKGYQHHSDPSDSNPFGSNIILT